MEKRVREACKNAADAVVCLGCEETLSGRIRMAGMIYEHLAPLCGPVYVVTSGGVANVNAPNARIDVRAGGIAKLPENSSGVALTVNEGGTACNHLSMS